MRWTRADGPQTRRYWDCNFVVDEDHTDRYFHNRLAELLEESVRLQLRSDVPLGTYLSGGADSSLVTALATKLSPKRITAFHGRFDEGPQYDESAYARRVAEHTGVDYLEVVPCAADFVEDMPRVIRALDEPVAGPGVFPQYRVARLARENVTVVLGGQGGDEIFCGYARYLVGYLEQALQGAIFGTQEEGRHLVTLATIVPNLSVLRQYFPMMRHFWQEGLFDPMDQRYFRLIDRSPALERILSPDVAAARDEAAVFAAFQSEFNHPDTVSYINKMTHFDMRTLLPALLQVEDRVSMAVALESRVPLLDHRVVDLVTTMPPPQKFAGGRLKYALKAVAARCLPDDVVNRPDKMGFPVPLSEWMQDGPVRDFVCDVLLGRQARERGLFRSAELEKLIAAEARFGRQIWGALCLELWHREFNVA